MNAFSYKDEATYHGTQLPAKINFPSGRKHHHPLFTRWQTHFSIQTAKLKVYLYVNIYTGTSCFNIFYPSPPQAGILPSWSFTASGHWHCVQIVTACFLQLSFPFPFPTYPLYILILWLSRKLTVYPSSICSAREKPGSLHSGALCLQAF